MYCRRWSNIFIDFEKMLATFMLKYIFGKLSKNIAKLTWQKWKRKITYIFTNSRGELFTRNDTPTLGGESQGAGVTLMGAVK